MLLSMSSSVSWRCPVCREPLRAVERNFVCDNRHSFDQAKEGYVNLLLANKKNSADPGDNKAMLMSRRAFLERGFYAPLADSLAAKIQEYFPRDEQRPTPIAPLTVLDAGCGEGYYLAQLVQQLGTDTAFFGTDISRAAMRMAAKKYKKQYPNVQFAVASSYDLPLPNASVDVVVRVFAPASDDELLRVLKPGGICLWAHPGAQHLFALRQLIYDDPQPHDVAKTHIEGFTHREDMQVAYPLHLPDAESVAALLEMTPYYWSASAEKQAHCQGLEALDVGTDFCVTVLQKVL